VSAGTAARIAAELVRLFDVQERQLAHFDRADPAYGAGVRAALTRRARSGR